MKTSALFLLLSLLALASCSPTSDDPHPQAEGFVRFKVDGVQKEFKVTNTPMGLTLDDNVPVYVVSAVGLSPRSDGIKNFLNMALRNETLFQSGVEYQMQNPINYKGVPMVRILLTYANESGQIFNATLFQQAIPGIKVTDDARWKFTKITDNWVEGTFEGVLLGPFSPTSGRGNTELIITEGQFSMALLKSLP